MLCFCILIVALFAICFLVFWAELRSSINIIVNKGGLWVNTSLGINRLRLIGIGIRVMLGHRPRVWVRNPITGKYRRFDLPEKKKKRVSRKAGNSLGSIIKLVRKILLRRFEAKVQIGIEDDAAVTATLCGFIKAFLETIRTIGTRGQCTPKGFIHIYPNFGHDCLVLQIKCIIGLKVKDVVSDIMKIRG